LIPSSPMITSSLRSTRSTPELEPTLNSQALLIRNLLRV
jgi:hypothetical protein